MAMTRTTKNMTTEDARAARRWFITDADGQVLGRLASRVAGVLRGKENTTYSPHLDAGDFVVVVNAAKVRITGKKATDKIYIRHSGYPGGVREAAAGDVLRRHPARLIREAVEGMLPKNRLGRRLATKLKVYAGPDHPHRAQKPVPLLAATREA
jgi:large subunit ribosomal protein L13